ncbi:MAG: HAMP domain-containing sensor histidine kinase [Ilumatobacteraceae bacterium]
MSLRWKLTIVMSMVMVASSASIGFISYRSVESRLLTEIDRSLVEATNRLLDRPNPSVRFGPRGRVVVNVPERPLGIEQFVVQVSDRDGNVLAATDGVELPATSLSSAGPSRQPGFGGSGLIESRAVEVETATSTQGQAYRIRTVAVDLGASGVVIVQVGRDLAETHNVLDDLQHRILIIGGSIALLAAFAGWFVASGTTSRLRRLSTTVEEIASTTRLDIDVPVAGADEVGRLGRSFHDMLEALSRSKDQQQRLVQDAGHELRTPLTSLRMNVDVLRRHDDLTADMRSRVLDDLNRDAEELAQLVDEILTLAVEQTSTPMSVPSESIDMIALVREVAERTQRRSGRQIEPTMRIGIEEPVVVGRRALIERAVTNLLDNAVKFDGSGGRIDIDLAVADGAISVTVRDQGPGIPDGEVDLVFERFHRSDEARTLPGSGLGLSIVAEVARLHGGSHFARNRAEGGAEVGFSLPLAPLARP